MELVRPRLGIASHRPMFLLGGPKVTVVDPVRFVHYYQSEPGNQISENSKTATREKFFVSLSIEFNIFFGLTSLNSTSPLMVDISKFLFGVWRV